MLKSLDSIELAVAADMNECEEIKEEVIEHKFNPIITRRALSTARIGSIKPSMINKS